MKKLILTLVLVFGLSTSILEAKSSAPYARVTFTVFYTSLKPYGEWIEIDYGVYAWRPLYVRAGWAPYLIGRWVWTPYGWYWDSFEPFGWAVYHYGRWYYDDYYGWIWIPDYEWAPAWVEWRYTDYYIGWAPLPPYARISITIGIHYSVRWYSPYYYWNFVPVQYFCGYEVHKYAIGPKYKYRIYSDSKYSVNYRYEDGRIINYGVDRNFVERRGGRVLEAKVEETTRLRDFSERKFNERDNRVIVYKPDEREINRDVDFKIRRAERGTSLDVKKIQTPRERMDIKSRDRSTETLNNRNERMQKVDKIDRERNSDQRFDREQRFERNERQSYDRQEPIRKDENIRGRIEIERKPDNRDIPSRERNYDFERRSYERKIAQPESRTGENIFNRRNEIMDFGQPQIQNRQDVQKTFPEFRDRNIEQNRENIRNRDLENPRPVDREEDDKNFFKFSLSESNGASEIFWLRFLF